jgi:3-oxoacyl-[acyl-carrier-protein] synthase-3
MYLHGVASALPGQPVGNQELAARLGLTAAWIDAFVGTRSRHFSVDLVEGTARFSLADLCERAARDGLEQSGTAPQELAFVVLATATPDALMPTTAAEVASRLGAADVPVYQIQSGCSGAVQALALASALLAVGPGTGLVLGGDVCTKHLDLAADFRRLPPSELVNYVLFGDGAGAAVVGSGPRQGSLSFRSLGHRITGLVLPPGQRVEWYGATGRRDGDRGPAVSEDYKAVEQQVPALAQQAGAELLKDLGWPAETVRHLLPPQLGGRMTALIGSALREALGLSAAAEVSCVADTGNTGNALLFSQLELLLGVIGPGERALGVCVESSRWITAGFALEAK